MIVECPHCHEDNKVYVDLWQATPTAEPIIITCEECGKLFGSKFDMYLTYQAWKIRQ